MDRLTVKIPEFPFSIKHGEQVLLMGSCFSDEMHDRFRQHGFNSHSNPFGTIFHPVPLARFISETLSDHSTDRIHQREDVFLSWDASSAVYGMSHEEIEMNLQQIRSTWKDRLCSARVLFVTFGTSWGYEHRDLREIVANCHRYPQDSFVKRMSTVAEIVHPWKEAITMLKGLNAQIQIVFTVSPVRHSRDGLIENNRSKATLHLAVEELTNVKDVYYFPSYEIVIDELRDHRYYAEDLVHPNAQAVNFVWERLADRFFDRETRVISEKVFSLKRSLSHKIMYPESAEAERFKKQLENELISFKDMYPDIVW